MRVSLAVFPACHMGLQLMTAGCTMPDVSVMASRPDAGTRQESSAVVGEQRDAASDADAEQGKPDAKTPKSTDAGREKPNSPSRPSIDASTPEAKKDAALVRPMRDGPEEHEAGDDAGAPDPCAADPTGDACSQRCKVAFASVTDDPKYITTEVPASWTTVWGDGWNQHPFPTLPSPLGPALNASSNVGPWFDDFTTPGVFIGASVHLAEVFEPAMVLQRYSFTDCTSTAPSAWTMSGATGTQVTWKCVQGHSWLIVAVWPEDHSYIALMQAKITDACDLSYAAHAMETLKIVAPSEWREELR